MDILLNNNNDLVPGLKKKLIELQQNYATNSARINTIKRADSKIGSTDGYYGVGSYGQSNFYYNPYSSSNQHPNRL